MRTFKQFVESRDLFGKKNFDYDLSLASDMSQDNRDASILIMPMIRQVRAFIDYIGMLFPSERDSEFAGVRRQSKLRGQLGIDVTNVEPGEINNFYESLDFLHAELYKLLLGKGSLRVVFNEIERTLTTPVDTSNPRVNAKTERMKETIMKFVPELSKMNFKSTNLHYQKTNASIKELDKVRKSPRELSQRGYIHDTSGEI